MSGETAPRIVVIGAGVGGLAASLRLAHAGCAVTVVERAAEPGGKMRAFDTPAGPADAGPTVLTMKPVFDALFASAGERLEDHLTLERQSLLARHWWADGAELDLFDDPEESAAAIRAFAGPRAEADFRRFRARAALLYETFDAPVMQAAAPSLPALIGLTLRNARRLLPALAPWRSLAGALAADFADPRLRQLFGRYATYVGGAPDRSPGVLALIWRAEEKGVWRVQGGMRRLAQTLAALAARRGAEFRYGCGAARIETAGGRVAAVHLEDGTRLPADQILFNGDPAALSSGLLGAEARRAVRPSGVSPRSLSAYVWAFAARPEGRPLAHHNVFFGRVPRSEFDDLAAGRAPSDPTLYVCAQDRGDGGEAPAAGALERFEIIMNGPPGAAPPAEENDTCRKRVFETLAAMGLRFDPTPPTSALTRPQDFAALFPASAGSLYGRSPHGMTATFARPTARSRLAGLYLAGGGVHPGAGVPMATLSGARAAEAILTDRASTSASRRTATPGGMSTGFPTTASAPSRSSAS